MARPGRFLGWRMTPLTRRRFANFRANKRAYWSLVIFTGLFVISLFANLIANEKPLLVRYDGAGRVFGFNGRINGALED